MPSAWIPTAELTTMRADAELTMPDSCIISALTEVSDLQGGMTQSWVANGTVDCRIVAKSGDVRALASQNAATGAYTLTVPHDADIDVDDRATIDSIVYRVVFVDDVKDWRAAIRADVNLEVT